MFKVQANLKHMAGNAECSVNGLVCYGAGSRRIQMIAVDFVDWERLLR